MQATQNALVKTASTTPSNYLFATLSDEPEADNLLTSQSCGSPLADSCASRMALQPAASPVVQIVTHQSDVEASMPVPACLPLPMMQSPSAINDRIKLLQMTATRRGIAAGMRL